MSYTFLQWLMFFYIYCFVGWVIESTIVSIDTRKLVNRGFMRGPYLPLYGFGAIVMLFCTLPVRDNAFLTYIFGMAGATVLEYFTAVIMESIFKMRYWDYTRHRFNFQGRICALASLFWGLLSLFLVNVLHAPVERLVTGMNTTLAVVLTSIVSVIFAVDLVYSVKTALDVTKMLTKLTEVKAEMEKKAAELEQKKEELEHRLVEHRADVEIRIEDKLEAEEQAAKKRLAELREEYERAAEKMDFFRRSFIAAHPSASSEKFGTALQDLKERINNRKK